ncbi:S-layer homology domain-containing protein [Pseudalkalibacillus salsuginis]|uniref:S-layer homology domain-containing protein n=1 Tax=Pseudalkalibacillus salsuginis TaxID=2910972 RepID=UPI001F25D363|nr:S-layer homology domain-containing protein [Pseudalkalibacillus salsuginis]MCF6410090.1 S-layer homology domain-containing protein [Pseudalkalibacillus salsuginis]
MKKTLLSFAIALLVLAPLSNVQAANKMSNYLPIDLVENPDHWAAEVMMQLIDADIMKGYIEVNGDLYAKPDKKISRAEVAALLVRSLDLDSTKPGKDFTDVPEGFWGYDEIQIASALGIVNGITDTEFAPNKSITREQLAAMIVRSFKETVDFAGDHMHFSDVKNTWAKEYIDQASSVGIINGYGDGKFLPKGTATRAETSKMLIEALHLESVDLPSESELTELVINHENAVYEKLQTNDYRALYPIFDQYTIGFFHAMVTDSTDLYLALTENEGFEFSFEQVGTPQMKVISKNTRLAVVDLSNLSYNVTITYPDSTIETENDDSTSGMYFLRMVDGEWKIYSQAPHSFEHTSFEKSSIPEMKRTR